MGGIRQASPWYVILARPPHPRDVAVQRARLEREGQIEPITVRRDGTPDLDSWAYADAQVQAARDLEWPTILVTDEDGAQ